MIRLLVLVVSSEPGNNLGWFLLSTSELGAPSVSRDISLSLSLDCESVQHTFSSVRQVSSWKELLPLVNVNLQLLHLFLYCLVCGHGSYKSGTGYLKHFHMRHPKTIKDPIVVEEVNDAFNSIRE